jgi:hypothetical protein
MSERYDREEEARRETQGRHRDDEPLIDHEWHGAEDSRPRRASETERDMSEPVYRDSEQDLDRPLRRRSPTRDQMRSLHGS